MNRATTKGFKRIRQTAWCCGKNYQRWRFLNGCFPAGHTHCRVCGQPLHFIRRKTVNEIDLEAYRRRRNGFWENGRTSRGLRPRRRNFNLLTPQEKAWRELRSKIQMPAVDLDTTRLEREEILWT